MDSIERHSEPSCKGGCDNCASRAVEPCDQALITGWRLGLCAVGTFLMPLALAICGAVWGGPSGAGELVGGICGLAVGAAGAAVVTRAFSRRSRQAK